jgi:hypothetical protein
MERKTKLEQQQSSELEAHQETRAAPGTSFESVDELLRYDVAQVHPPAHVEERLAKSVENLPPPPRSWWQRWLGLG